MGRLPPLKALRAFEAAARHMSFKAAADELALTPTAISHQIRLLETALGRALFRRWPRPLTLTPAGAALFPVVRNGFESIAEAFAMVRSEDVSRRLKAIDARSGMRRSPATSEQVDEKPVTASTQPVRGSAIGRPEIPGDLVPSVLHPGSSSPRLSLAVLPFANVGPITSRNILPTVSPRASPSISRAFRARSSSPGTPPSPTRVRRSISGKSAAT